MDSFAIPKQFFMMEKLLKRFVRTEKPGFFLMNLEATRIENTLRLICGENNAREEIQNLNRQNWKIKCCIASFLLKESLT